MEISAHGSLLHDVQTCAHGLGRGGGAIAAALLMTMACGGCSDSGEVGKDENGETGGDFDGVYINCLNENELNYWYQFDSQGVPQMHHGTPPAQPLNACIGQPNMGAEFNLVDDWDVNEYGYPGFDSEIRALCSERCGLAHTKTTLQTEVCEDENWSGHAVRHINYDPAVTGYTCKVSVVHPYVQGDPFAGDVDWNQGSSRVLNIPLACSLIDDCAAEFDADIDEWVLGFSGGGVFDIIDAHTRNAAFSAASGTTGVYLELDMNDGSGAGYDDSHFLVGHAEYSPSNCGQSTCPFYLAAFEASNFSDEWEIYLGVPPIVSEHKEVSNVQVEALQSTMAAWRPSTGQVAFPPGTLLLQVEFELSNNTCTGSCTGFGNGVYSRVLANSEVVFGFYDVGDGSLSLEYAFPIIDGEATLGVELTVDGHPPEAEIDLSSQVRCNHPDGHELSWSDSASSDPDSDIDFIVWYVDGEPRANGFVVPLGTHLIDLLAVDSRGAHDFAGTQAFEVIVGPACL